MEEGKKQINKDGDKLETLQTYMSDMADVVRDKEMSVIKIATAEQKKQEQENYYLKKKTPNKNKILFIFGGIILIILAILFSYLLIRKAKEKSLPPKIIRTIETPISYDNKITIDVTGATDKNDLSKLINSRLIKNNNYKLINAIFLTKKIDGIISPLSLVNFLSLLKTTAPDSLIRSFSKNYMLGIYDPNNQNPPSLFLIIGIRDYPMAYARMLKWEKTMVGDLFSIFKINVSGTNSGLFEKPFSDVIIRNKDARILYNKEGIGELFYLFPNKNTLVIAKSQNAIREIITRLILKETLPK